MDQWDFKKWRKKLGINQVAAGEMLRLSRGVNRRGVPTPIGALSY
jgi:hypothetical protein